MKHYLLAFLACAAFAFTANAVIIQDFENLPDGTTNLIGVVFQSTGGVDVTLEDNPNPGGINTSAKVARAKIYMGGATSGIIRLCFTGTCTPLLGYPEHPNFATDGTIYDRLRFKYYKGNLTDRVVYFEPYGNSSHAELQKATASDKDAWQYITFELIASSYGDIQFRLNRNTAGGTPTTVDGDYIYVDDFEFYNSKEGSNPGTINTLMIANFEGDGTDKYCDGRFQQVGGGSDMEIITNPYTTGNNTSAKVLRLYNFNSAGAFHLRLSTDPPIVNAADKITDAISYDGLRLKYKVNDAATYSQQNAIIKVYGASTSETGGVWSDTTEDWKTVTFNFANFDNAPTSIPSIHVIPYNTLWSADATLEIFLDDIELFKTDPNPPTSLQTVNDNEYAFSCTASGDNAFTVSSFVPQAANVRIDLISLDGRTQPVYNQTAEGNLEVPFQVTGKGLYLVRVSIDGNSKTMKIISK